MGSLFHRVHLVMHMVSLLVGSSRSICLALQARQVRTKLIMVPRLVLLIMRIAVMHRIAGRGPLMSLTPPLFPRKILLLYHSFLIEAPDKTMLIQTHRL